jgi:hypothetical protein
VLLTGLTVATTVVVEDVDGRPPRWVLLMGPAAAATVVEEDVDGGTWPLSRGPDPTFCLDVYWFLQVSSHIAVITPVIF